jgi:serine protease AprX
MKLKHILVSIGIISVISAPYTFASTFTFNPKIDKYVQTQLHSKIQNNRTVFVILKDQANLSEADAFTSREEKGRYVYETLRNTALNTQKSLVAYLKSQKIEFRQFYIENMIAIENPTPELIKRLAERADVARIMGNPLTKLKLPKMKHLINASASITGPEQNLVRMGATKVWENSHVRGEGIVVAGQDTGVQWDHPALIHQYRGFSADGKVDHNYNWHDAIHRRVDNSSLTTSSCGYDSKTPCDDVGHGTHTIGTVVGDDGKGNQIGVAPKAQWVACKNMDNGVGTPASYIECFEFFLAPYPLNGNPLTDGNPAKAPHIINNSWGCTKDEGCKGDEILPALQAMKKAGILVVASAGNEGPGCASIDSPPAWHSGLTLSVGAFNHRTDNIAYFSSRGPSALNGGTGPNIAAPGVSIRSSVPGNRYEGSMWSGTSMAGPHAVGAAALLWSFNKDLIGHIEQTISIIENSAEPKTTNESCGGVPGSHIPNNTYGSGLLNVWKAICSQSDKCEA